MKSAVPRIYDAAAWTADLLAAFLRANDSLRQV